MNARRVLLIGVGLLSTFAPIPSAHSAEGMAQNGKPVIITRFFTGQDGLIHAEEIEVKFAPAVARITCSPIPARSFAVRLPAPKTTMTRLHAANM